MKNSIRTSSFSRGGFTLVELLVVIAIIAILASVVAVAAGGAINAAKRAKASNTATQIQTAIINYYTEYGVYPVPPNTTTDKYYSDADTSQQGLFYALCGNMNASTPTSNGTSSTSDVPNTRQIAYMTPKPGDVDKLGILISPFSTVANPSYFYIAIDSDYDGLVGSSGGISLPNFTTWGTGQTASTPITQGVTQGAAIWADCDTSSLPPKEAASKTPAFWIHTY